MTRICYNQFNGHTHQKILKTGDVLSLKKIMALALAFLMLTLAGCDMIVDKYVTGYGAIDAAVSQSDESWEPDKTVETDEFGGIPDEYTDDVINVYAYTNEIVDIVNRFAAVKKIPRNLFNIYLFSVQDQAYENALDGALTSGAADLFLVDDPSVKKYAESPNVAGLNSLGLDSGKIKDAGIPDYLVDEGTNSSGVRKALCYTSGAGGFLYRADLAKKVLGTDDPAEVGKLISDWDKFLNVAEQMNHNGIAMLAGTYELQLAYLGGRDTAWVDDKNQLVIDDGATEYFKFMKTVNQNGYTNNDYAWTEGWFCGMSGTSSRPVFGYFGPGWFANWILGLNMGGTYGKWRVTTPPSGYTWGGTYVMAAKECKNKKLVADLIEWMTLDTSKTGYQTSALNGWKNPIAVSSVVNGHYIDYSDFHGGNQPDAIDFFVDSGKLINGKAHTQYDEKINEMFNRCAASYSEGGDKESIVDGFKESVKEAFPEIHIIYVPKDEELPSKVFGRLGRYYAVYNEPNISWENASEFCEFAGGHLLTITLKEEQRFISKLLSQSEFEKASYYWMNARSSNSGNSYKWMSDEDWRLSNWEEEYPTGQGNHAAYISSETLKWSDIPNNDNSAISSRGFICEWDSIESIDSRVCSIDDITEDTSLTLSQIVDLIIAAAAVFLVILILLVIAIVISKKRRKK